MHAGNASGYIHYPKVNKERTMEVAGTENEWEIVSNHLSPEYEKEAYE